MGLAVQLLFLATGVFLVRGDSDGETASPLTTTGSTTTTTASTSTTGPFKVAD